MKPNSQKSLTEDERIIILPRLYSPEPIGSTRACAQLVDIESPSLGASDVIFAVVFFFC
jgi:hypothetical protein